MFGLFFIGYIFPCIFSSQGSKKGKKIMINLNFKSLECLYDAPSTKLFKIVGPEPKSSRVVPLLIFMENQYCKSVRSNKRLFGLRITLLLTTQKIYHTYIITNWKRKEEKSS